jgi:hypothetical protein
MTQSSEDLGDLVGGGLCFSHSHVESVPITHDTVVNYQRLKVQRSASSVTSLTVNDDLLLVDTAGGSVSVTLPVSGASGKEFIVFKTNAANTLTILRSGSDLINGAASLPLTTSYSSLWLKAVAGGWVAR